MGLRRLLFGDPPCFCGSGKPDRFCARSGHRGAMRQGTTRNGARTSGGGRVVRDQRRGR